MSSPNSKTSAITPCRTMRGHTNWVYGVVHLPDGERIITCSLDGSLRLWNLKSGAQIGEDWWDGDNEMWSMALSPNGKISVSGSGGNDYDMRLWDVETRKVIANWTGHTDVVCALCWSAEGERVASGSWDGTARIWDDSGTNIMIIETGHGWVNAVMYSPDSSKLATGGEYEFTIKIWDAKTGELLNTLKHNRRVFGLAWTSDGRKLISGSDGPIRIFDTATWQQIAVLRGHTDRVTAISLSQNNRLLASTSTDKTACLWNLDTNLPVGLPLQHERVLRSAALSPDGKVLVTGCENKIAYTWDVHAILKEASLEDLLPISANIAPKDRLEQDDSGTQHTPRSSLSDKSFLEADATRCPGQFGGLDELSPTFFDGMEASVDSSPMGGAHPHSSVNALLARLSSLLHRFRPDSGETTELPQPSKLSGFHPHALLARLSSFIHRSPPENDAPDELQQPSMPSRLDPHVLLAHLSSLLSRSRHGTDEEAEPQPITPSSSHPDALISWLSSVFRSQPHTNEEIELTQRTMHPHVVKVPAMRDREACLSPVLFVSESTNRTRTQPTGTTIPSTRPAHSLPVRMLAHLVLFLCCASPQHVDDNAHPTRQHEDQSQTPAPSSQTQHQQGQSQDQPLAHASSSQTQPTASSTTTPATLDAHSTAPGAANRQPRPLPLRTRFVLFLCSSGHPSRLRIWFFSPQYRVGFNAIPWPILDFNLRQSLETWPDYKFCQHSPFFVARSESSLQFVDVLTLILYGDDTENLPVSTILNCTIIHDFIPPLANPHNLADMRVFRRPLVVGFFVSALIKPTYL
ncbi:quinon protein alcohol dehydrogenase-like superfamily [Suillus subalutaceus]|uniref:quinon protein alcohol dehydrogenase-like superfamily n=1 Tax=Suillus subalutaceus TaxID=48586 RepID=UPI001B87693D|nr:quinon protein alcohol dehydrogenase-like superfamily [Suillus subalutaceus]KAG1837573.1 quinon protein alcohol dehydrogenase-like superfamily [Suillus subalutaceus]